MHRELKFRIWDKENKEFFKPTYRAYEGELADLFIAPSGDLNMRTMTDMVHESMFPDRFEIMQYTGLKDRKGQEIYEGDICGDGQGALATIEWVQDHCQFLWIYEEDMQEIGDWCIVVGNIHEHPHLLKGEEA